jgi:hypothetical protein
MILRKWYLSALAISALTLNGLAVSAADAPKQPARDSVTFGTLQSPNPETAKTQALEWLKAAGKTDADSLKNFETIWSSDVTLLDKVSATLTLGDANAARLLAEARDPQSSAPTTVPAILKDSKVNSYLRDNLALAYSKALISRRIFEDALESLKTTKAEQVVDPSAYCFYRAVAEHTLMLRKEADDSVFRLLDDVVDAPVRYRNVAALMHIDMLSWQDNDLGWIARKMGVIKDRLEIARGGNKTQKYQKDVLVRLDEMIKEMENCKGGCCGNCPGGGSGSGMPNGNQVGSNGAKDSALPNAGGLPGSVDPKRLKEIADVWGTLPEKERAKYVQDVTRSMPIKYRETIQIYLKSIGSRSLESASK